MSIKLCDGKYEFTVDAGGALLCSRNGELWRHFVGDKAVHALYEHALELQARLIWIDVSVRTPDDSSPVLVYQGDASHTKRTAYYFFGRWSWTDATYEHRCQPEAWMQIPPHTT